MLENLPSFIARPLAAFLNNSGALGDWVNRIAINSAVNQSRHRPHPWSTVHDYVSWTGLTDRRFLARHRPAYFPPAGDAPLPDEAQLVPLFQRRGGPILSDKSTCLFPAFAQYLTDGFLRTRMPHQGEDPQLRRQNTSNHQIDMCPLYGRTEGQVRELRLGSEARGERGRLKSQFIGDEEYAPFLYRDGAAPDPKAEFATLDPPLGVDARTPAALRARIFAFGGDRGNSTPHVAMLNTLFLREHNRLAAEIERANPGWGDERVFETARNCVIVMFIKIVVEEYINHISASPFHLRADPSVAWDAPWNKPNWITAEFSLLYRWHSLIPDELTWSGSSFPIMNTLFNNELLIQAGLRRAFADISSQRAGRLGAFNTAPDLLQLEVLALRQDRLVNLAPYVEYRKYVSLPALPGFEGISRDPRVVDLLKSAYGGRMDRVEFYVGLFAEDPVPRSPLPPLMQRMVAVDAFSQALTNPLLSRHVFNPGTFSDLGWQEIRNTHTLRDLLNRNVRGGIQNDFVGMTQPGWL